MLPVTSISLAARRLRAYLAEHIADLEETGVFIDHPKHAIDRVEDGRQHLNLFFYRLEHDGYPAHATSDDPVYFRLHCLITALGADDNESIEELIPAGENDLRLIGEVVRLLHQRPMLDLLDPASRPIAQLQIVPTPFSPDDINRLWSTQGDTPYRLSVPYEMALVPIPLARPRQTSKRVGALGVAAGPGIDPGSALGGTVDVPTTASVLPIISVDIARSDWTPRIGLVMADDSLRHAVVFSSAAVVPETLSVIIAGNPDEPVQLQWEVWQATDGWTVWKPSTAMILPPNGPILDPGAAGSHSVPLPLIGEGAVAEYPAQATLQVIREWPNPRTGSIEAIKSNLLLVSIGQEDA